MLIKTQTFLFLDKIFFALGIFCLLECEIVRDTRKVERKRLVIIVWSTTRTNLAWIRVIGNFSCQLMKIKGEMHNILEKI